MSNEILASINIDTEKEPITISKDDIEEVWTKSFSMTSTSNEVFYFNAMPIIDNEKFKLRIRSSAEDYEFYTKEEDITEHAKLLLNSLKNDSSKQNLTYIDTAINNLKRCIQVDFLSANPPQLFKDIVLEGKGIIKIGDELADIFGTLQLISPMNKLIFVCDNAVRKINPAFMKNKLLNIYFIPNKSQKAVKVMGPPKTEIPEEWGIYNACYTFDYISSILVNEPDNIFKNFIGYKKGLDGMFKTAAFKVLNAAQAKKQNRAIDIF